MERNVLFYHLLRLSLTGGGGLTMTDRGNTVTCCYFSFTGKCFESKQAFSISQSSARSSTAPNSEEGS